jgi:5'-deoxynucleotidase YfbR-like HD superfamily hydrolase
MSKLEQGNITTISGNIVNILEPTKSTVKIEDLAFSLGRILRYNGHIRQDWSVAQHSVVMSYAVPEEYALEALLHDIPEGYMGDMIHPVKELFPEISTFEEVLAADIIRTLLPEQADDLLTWNEHKDRWEYHKSDVVAEFDHKMYEQECFNFGDRPGKFHKDMDDAWEEAMETHFDSFHAGWDMFMERYEALTGYKRDKEMEQWDWFKIPTEAMIEELAKEAQ